MTAESDPVAQAINDARALLGTLLASDWREIHVISGGTEIFLARPGGGANPMLAAPAAPHPAAPETIAPARERAVKAPHVATLVDVLRVGTAVAAGDAVATLRVLDEQEVVAAPVAGTLYRIDAEVGVLLDYGAPLLVIAEAA